MKHLCLSILVLFPCFLFGQITIGGVIIDRQSKAPIPFASISVAGGQNGTISNEAGEFLLAVSVLPVELIVTHVSYQRMTYSVQSTGVKIVVEMHQSLVYLNEVAVDGNAAYKILAEVYRKSIEGRNIGHFGKAFYRQISFMDDTPIELLEGFYDTEFNNNGIVAWEIKEGRFAKKAEKGSLDFLNFSTFTSGMAIYQERPRPIMLPLSRDGLEQYDFDILNIYNENDRELVEILCKPHPHASKAVFEGTLFIDNTLKQVLKVSGQMVLGNSGLELTYEHKSIPYRDAVLGIEIAYANPQMGQLMLSYIKASLKFLYSVESVQHTAEINSLYALYLHQSSLQNARLKKAKRNVNDLKIIQSVHYNAEFWKDNPIVKRTPVEEDIVHSFESRGAFGNYGQDH